MRIRVLVAGLGIALVAAALPAVAQPGTQQKPTIAWRTSSVVAGDLGPAQGSARQWAVAAVERYVGGRDLQVTVVRRSLIGTHVRGHQSRGGLPVDGTDWVASAIGGRIVQVEAHPSALPGSPAARPVGPAVARAAALAHLGSTAQLRPPVVRRVLVPHVDRLVDTYRVSVVSTRPARAAVVEVAAIDGRVLGVRDETKKVDGTAMVFDPSPSVTKRDRSLRQPAEVGSQVDADLDSAELTAQRERLALRGLDAAALGQGRLSGPFVNVLGAGYGSSTATFDLTRGDPRFEGLMAYAHLDRFQRHLQSLGFRGAAAVNAEPQEVMGSGLQGFDNSLYDDGTDLILLGSGGVDDGEDAEIVLHEYGHAMQFAQVPGFGRTTEGGAMGEGFGDFVAAAYYARSSGGWGDTCFGDWDATTYSTSSQPCLRRLDTPKTYPDDVEDAVHADGEIWSGFLWQVRAGLPGSAAARSDAALRLVIASHELLSSQSGFADGVAALRVTARALGQPEWVRAIDRAAGKRGLPTSP